MKRIALLLLGFSLLQAAEPDRAIGPTDACVPLVIGEGEVQPSQNFSGFCYGRLNSTDPFSGYWAGTCDVSTNLNTGETHVEINGSFPEIRDFVLDQPLVVAIQWRDGGMYVPAFQLVSIQNWGWFSTTPASLDAQADLKRLSDTLEFFGSYIVCINASGSGVLSIKIQEMKP